jgi:predicted nucleic acid-binding Zn ribbon protein
MSPRRHRGESYTTGRKCAACGAGPLTQVYGGRPKRFCSDRCRWRLSKSQERRLARARLGTPPPTIEESGTVAGTP